MNEVFLDTETTGLSFQDGHKIVEIACIFAIFLTNKKVKFLTQKKAKARYLLAIPFVNGNINKYSIDRFDSYLELNSGNILLKNTYLSSGDEYLEGNLDFSLDDKFNINRFNKICLF